MPDKELKLCTLQVNVGTVEAHAATAEQLDTYLDVVARYKTLGRVGLNGPQLNIARAAAYVFDSLIEMDRNGVAIRAALWSREQLDKFRNELG
jgi:hypothetical protein